MPHEVKKECSYYDAYPEVLTRILEHCTKDAILAFMKSIGIVCKEKRGYYYPASEQAAVVVQMLQAELIHNKVAINTEEYCKECYKEENLFHVITDKAEYWAECLIMASGGMAAPKLGADSSGYQMLEHKTAFTGVSTVDDKRTLCKEDVRCQNRGSHSLAL